MNKNIFKKKKDSTENRYKPYNNIHNAMYLYIQQYNAMYPIGVVHSIHLLYYGYKIDIPLYIFDRYITGI